MRKLYNLTKYDKRHVKIGITCKWPTSMGEYIAVRVEDDETVESMFDLYPSHVSSVQLYLEKEDIDHISIQGNDEVQTHGHIDDNLHTQHYEYQQPTGHFTRMLNDDVDSTGFYSANERDVRYESYDYTLPTDYNTWSIGYGGGSSQYPFMSITDPSHTFPSASSSGHHVTEEHVIEEDEEDEIDLQDDIDDNENMEEGDDEPLFDIARVNNTEIEYEQDPPNVFTSDHWIDEATMNNSHEGIDVPCTFEGEEPHVGQIFTNKKNMIYALQTYSVKHKMEQFAGPVDTSVLYAQSSHRSQLVHAGQLSIACKSGAKAICGSLTLLQIRWEPYTADILEMLPAISRQASHLWLSRVPLLSFSIVEMHVPDRVLRQFGRVQHIPGPVDVLDRVTRKGTWAY
ncbi:hypothetical protein Taro_025317 [Colocasia esculenta]|uniref:Aminotransferase-like plant mobile domain-containing protein n=1 Tax=Colocasia esculenta TaxID=4460 RepID=A0A843VN02_COLES|nr:hypothetical protein [Colocasia esculenta]